jgi:CRISPR system Cascade subunit CasC
MDGGKAADVAMFGRMLADLPEHNIDAACQVSHALAVNKLAIDSDYYTAVDDLKPDDNAGADMIGAVDLTSACYYRYLNVHTRQLVKNLDGDKDLAMRTVKAFLRAAVDAVPSGKQNGTAAHNPPSLVMAVVRPSGCWNLANAFVKPVGSHDDGLIANAIKELVGEWAGLKQMYGDKKDDWTVAVCARPQKALKALSGHLKESVQEVLDAAVQALNNLEAGK